MRNQNSKTTDRVLIAAGDISYGTSLVRYLQMDGHQLELVHDARGVLRLVGRRDFDVIVLDLSLNDEADVNLVSFVRQRSPRTKLIVLFEPSRMERALEAIRQGAYFYLPVSSSPSDVALVVGKAIRTLGTEATVRQVERDAVEEILGGTPAMNRVIEQVTKVAPTDSTVLLLGESGTGKEVVANTIHRLSNRSERPFIAINCAALPEGLLESEMFGHVKGAFTGAESDKRGLFEEADGGTIFLDEIGDMALITQAKLLRVLQNGEIRPVGASVARRVDVRVIAATNRDLEKAVREGTFREDLYFRLNVIAIRIPPLRERMDVLPKLVRFFIGRYNARFGRSITDVDEQAQVLLRNYPYPGNIRELESIMAHAVIMAEGNVIRARDLPDQLREGEAPRLALPDRTSDSIPSLQQMEEQLIRTALQKLDGNQTEVAKRLGISRSTLWRKMKEYSIDR